MFSRAKISHLGELDPSYLSVNALRSTEIRHRINDGTVGLGLFDETDLFAITHPDYLGDACSWRRTKPGASDVRLSAEPC